MVRMSVLCGIMYVEQGGDCHVESSCKTIHEYRKNTSAPAGSCREDGGAVQAGSEYKTCGHIWQ